MHLCVTYEPHTYPGAESDNKVTLFIKSSILLETWNIPIRNIYRQSETEFKIPTTQIIQLLAVFMSGSLYTNKFISYNQTCEYAHAQPQI